jgi:AraC-like DNA-binding protein
MVARAPARGLTSRDEYLTFHDMSDSVRAASLRGFDELVRGLGGDTLALLRSQKLPAASLTDEELLLPVHKLARLLEACASVLDCPDFGLRLAQAQDIGILGPVAVAIQNAPTLGEAMKIASQYLYVHNQGLAITVAPDSENVGALDQLRYEMPASYGPASHQSFELMLCGGHRFLGALGGEHYRLHAVHLPHPPLAKLSAYRRAFGLTPLFEQASASLVVHHSLFDTPLRQANPTLRALATHYLETNFNAPQQSLLVRVRLAIARTLGTSQCALEGVAAILSMHPRTLQRQLSAEGARFFDLRDAALREAALRYLAGPMPLAQVSAQLGLSEQSALTRSCKRWFGDTPLAVRLRAGSMPGAAAGPKKIR